MTQQESTEFIRANKDNFEELGRLMRQVDTVHGCNTVKDFQGRQIAINLINAWLMQIWNIAYEDIMVDEEDDIIKRVTNKLQE